LELMRKSGILEKEVVERVLAEVEDDEEEVVDAELLPSEDNGDDDDE